MKQKKVYPWDLQSPVQHSKYFCSILKIQQLLDTNSIIFYTRYVDDILIVYDTTRTHPDLINTYINQIHTDIQLNPTYENNGRTSFLHLLIIRKTSNLEIDTYRTDYHRHNTRFPFKLPHGTQDRCIQTSRY